VRDGDALFVRTMANSGKMKRLKNNSTVKVAICDMRGSVLGKWFSGQGEIINDPAKEAHVNKLLTKKYGLMKRLLDWRAKSKENDSGTMQIKLNMEQVQ
jgi:PPOX class probable F420-dependent enzyme